jgi:hypothetical protein
MGGYLCRSFTALCGHSLWRRIPGPTTEPPIHPVVGLFSAFTIGVIQIVGYSEPEGSRPYLGALLLACYDDDGRLVYAGRAHGHVASRTQARL